MINFSVVSNQIFIILGLLKLSHREESDFSISFIIFALFKKILILKILIRFNCKYKLLIYIKLILLI